ncbi:hypothetical protein [uncultured Draconibacterium sp.]|uniref:hypothetical protein n=1 Tax=uncultured Draconibacterium sp. TaxID=1573823 RepID=UPI0025FB17F5|nr:hypothetical protein [uncultured Draconibacterium sp.]
MKEKGISLQDAIDRDIPKGTKERDEFDKKLMEELSKQDTYQKCTTCGTEHLIGTMCPKCF